jgi:hypothetical protein
MKIIKSTPRPNGKTRLIIELDDGEGIQLVKDSENVAICPAHQKPIVIDPDAHYSLGEPMREDIIAGHILAEAKRVHWCSIQQKWVD